MKFEKGTANGLLDCQDLHVKVLDNEKNLEHQV